MFKRIILYLGIVLCIVTTAGCSNHDEPKEPIDGDYLYGMYTDDSPLWKLSLTVNGRPTQGKSVWIASYADRHPAFMTLYDIVPGKSECRIPIEISAVGDDEDYSYHFSGEYSYKKNKTLRYDGVITYPYGFLSQAVLTLDIQL